MKMIEMKERKKGLGRFEVCVCVCACKKDRSSSCPALVEVD